MLEVGELLERRGKSREDGSRAGRIHCFTEQWTGSATYDLLTVLALVSEQPNTSRAVAGAMTRRQDTCFVIRKIIKSRPCPRRSKFRPLALWASHALPSHARSILCRS